MPFKICAMSEVMKLKKHASSSKLFVISISIVIFFCVIGIGYSKWNGGIELSSLLSTGSMNVIFDNNRCEIMEQSSPLPEMTCDTKAFDPQISHRGKSLYVVIENAYPGYSATIKYGITNKGDIPVYCKLITGAEGIDIIEIDKPTGVLEANGGRDEGTFRISIPESTSENNKDKTNESTEESENYNLILSLDYVQYNEIS